MAVTVRCCLFGLLLLPLANSKSCHPPLKVQINQRRLATRPSDNVTLECHFSGIPNNEVIEYTWSSGNLITIYRYNTTSHMAWWHENYDGKVNESHIFFSDGIRTNLEITVHISDVLSYRCEFYTKQKMCRDKKRIDFQDHVTSPSPTTVQNFDDPDVSHSPTTVQYRDVGGSSLLHSCWESILYACSATGLVALIVIIPPTVYFVKKKTEQ